MEEKNLNSSINLSSLLDSNILPLFPISIMFFAHKKMKGFIMENCCLKDLNKKDVFDYLICNRIFIDSLSDEEIKKYKKYFINFNRLRFKEKIFKFLKLYK